MDFKPKINPTSQDLARRSQKNFNQRTMDHYINKHKREEKSTNDIEFQKAAGELTFHPKLSTSGP